MIKRSIAPALLFSVLSLLPGCANLYEGVKAREDALRTPAERAISPQAAPYEQYEAERRKAGGGR